MARLFTCGFEENNQAETMWTVAAGTIVTTPVNSGTHALDLTAGIVNRRNLSAAVTSGTFYIRFYYRHTGAAGADRQIFSWRRTGNTRVNAIQLRTTAVLQLINDLTTTTADSTTTLDTNTWYRIEVEYVALDASGSITLRIYLGDSTSILETVSITGEDTLDVDVNGFQIHSGSGLTGFFDDVVLNDDAGAAPFNTWVGPSKIAFQETISDDTVAWERNTGSVNSDNVDDLPGLPDDITTYNLEAVTLNSVDRLNASTLPVEVPSDATIIAVDVYARVGSDQTSDANMRLKLWEEDATLTNGPTMDVGLNGWRILTTAEHLVFDADGKTKANVESFDYGYENITDVATRERRITALWVNVEWIEAVPVTNVFLPGQFGQPQPIGIRREVVPY